jgi:hypothetical protein
MDAIAWSRSRNEAALSELESPVALVTSRVKEPTLEEQFLLRRRSSHFNNRRPELDTHLEAEESASGSGAASQF